MNYKYLLLSTFIIIIKRFLFVCFNVSDLWRPLIERFLSYLYLYSCEPTIPKQLVVLLSLKEFLWLLIPRPPLENQWRSSSSLFCFWSCSPFVAPVTSNKVTEFHRHVSYFDLLSGFLILSLFRQRSQSSISPPTATAASNDIGSSMSPPSLSYRSAGAAPQANGKSTKQPPGSILYKEN